MQDVGVNPGSRRSPGAGNGNPLQYSCWKIVQSDIQPYNKISNLRDQNPFEEVSLGLKLE